jgi:hypothetical protein
VRWGLSWRFDPAALPLADRHYNRQKPGSPQFVPPGRCVVLLTADRKALWVSSWPYAQFTRHAWAGAWVCSLFRNEGAGLSSELINEAVAATRWVWPKIPPQGFVTFVDRQKTKPKKNPGFCYQAAGWAPCGMTKGGLHALRLAPAQMPAREAPLGAQGGLFDEAV